MNLTQSIFRNENLEFKKLCWKFSMILVFLFILSFLSLTRAYDDPRFLYHTCPNSKTFTNNSAYQSNLNLLLATLRSNTTHGNKFSNGFYNTTAGQDPDKVYGIFLCRGDQTSSSCQNCVNFATSYVTQLCPVEKETVIWYDECLLRYSHKSFFSTTVEQPNITLWNRENVTLRDRLDQEVRNLMTTAVNHALNSSKMYATAKENLTTFQTLYGLVQCTPDLSRGDCSTCLRNAISKLLECCSHKEGGRVLYPSCNIRYEVYPFYNETLTAARTPTPVISPPPFAGSVTRSKGRKGMKATWIAIIGTTFSATIVVGLLGFCIWSKQRRNKDNRAIRQVIKILSSNKDKNIGDEYSNDILGRDKKVETHEFPIFPLGLTLEATQHFSRENKLGEGGFGSVYKGVLADGKEIAVKRLSKTSGQGLQEFKNEVTLIAKLQHKNLVRLLGCCLEGNELLLIYEYMANKSLDFLLFDSTRGAQLDWKRRVSIINGISRGLLYLHEDSRLKVIHRDLKASNVLLDHEMNPKISDFGMARIFGGNQNEANTNRVVGTYGYMAPEYAMEGLFSVKSDVFSFGVLLLEIINGKKNSGFHLSEHGQSLLTYAWKLWCKGEALELMDPVLKQSCVRAELLKCIHIGLLCVQEDPADRPTMSSVVVMLATDTIDLPQPTQPAFSVSRIIAKSGKSSSDPKICSVNDVTFSNVSPR